MKSKRMTLTFAYLLVSICSLPATANADGAVLEISPSQLTLYFHPAGPATQSHPLSISDVGSDNMSWLASPGCGWIQAIPHGGRMRPGTTTTYLNVDVSGMGIGSYNCEVTVSSVEAANSPQTVQVLAYIDRMLRVPAQYATIQQAIDAAINGDTVVVAPGTHTGPGNRDIDYLGKAITVRSIDPNDPDIVDETVIDGANNYHGFYFNNGEGTDSLLEGLTISNCRGSSGGGIRCDNSSPTIRKCVITNNHATLGGGIYCKDSSSDIRDCTITDNRAIGYWSGGFGWGGGIYCENGSPTISNCVIKNCSALSNLQYASGGGMYFYKGSPTISNCVIESCEVRNIVGSGLYQPLEYSGGGGMCFVGAEPTIVDCNISSNTVEGKYEESGGGILFYDCSGEIAGCMITGNSAGGGWPFFYLPHKGGGIHCKNDNTTITGCTITANSAEGYGGGVYGCVLVNNCTISGNTAKYGGGLGSCATVANCLVSENTAQGPDVGYIGDGGGGLYDCGNITSCVISGNKACYGAGLYDAKRVFGSTIAGNLAKNKGGGIYFVCDYDAGALLTSSIVRDNKAAAGSQISLGYYGSNTTFSANYCDIEGGLGQVMITSGWVIDWGDENIDEEPLFVAAGVWDTNGTPDDITDDLWIDGDYHLTVESACINAGEPGSADGGDIDGQPRIMGCRVDMGADEYEPVIGLGKPAGGEVWAAGSSHYIQWCSYNITGAVDISYSANNGDDWVTIEDDTANTGSYLWQVPDKIDSNQCLVSVVPVAADANTAVIPSDLFEINRYPQNLVPPPGRPNRNKQRRSGLSENIGPELGCIKWKFETDGPVTASVALGHNNRVYVPCEDGRLYALNNSGELAWSYDANSPLINSPAVGNWGGVYITPENGRVCALDNNGGVLWTYQVQGQVYSSPVVSGDGNMYICTQQGTIYAIDCRGSELWQFKTADFGRLGSAVFATPAIGQDGTVYVPGLYDPNLYALDASDGGIKWACNLSRQALVNPRWPEFGYTQKFGWPFASPAIADDGTIYQTLLYDPNLYAIEPNSGTIIWSANMKPQCDYVDDYFNYYGRYPSCGAIAAECSDWFGFEPNEWCRHIERTSCWSAPAVGPDGTVYVSFDDPYLRAVEPNGDIKWVTRLGTVGGFTLTIGPNGLIYAAGDDGAMYVVNPAGEEISRFQTEQWLSYPVITVGKTIIVSDYNDTVWAIGGDDCKGQTSGLHRPQDLNGDRAVNFQDYLKFAADWAGAAVTGADGSMYPAGDINRDGQVDFADMALLANRWLKQD